MATNVATTIELSAPQIVVNGYVWAIVPNSLKVHIPGEYKVRSISSGGGGTQIVAGLDAVDMIGKINFKVPNVKSNFNYVRELKAQMINQGLGCTIQINDRLTDFSIAYQNMFFTKKTDAEFKSNGDIPIEFEGEMVA